MTTWGWGRIGKSPTAEMVDVVWPVLVAVCEKRVNKENYVDLKQYQDLKCLNLWF